MGEVSFARLSDLPLRDAWKHEAQEFTPWLAENMEHLSDAIGVPLELTGTEVSVENFSADILARNALDDTVVLIENQLEATDHTHLGQIMTYLAGLDAQTVVWVAPSFREPHLSAVRWLNEHTSDGFSFFAVRVRVVRIGDSPLAPIFEVVEKPNDWDRQLTSKRRETGGGSAIGDMRHAYWTAYAARYPDAGKVVSRLSFFTGTTANMPDVTVAVWIGQKYGGIYLRGLNGEDIALVEERLAPHADWLEDRLGVPFRTGNNLLSAKHPGSVADQTTWNELIDWQEERRRDYIAALDELGFEQARD